MNFIYWLPCAAYGRGIGHGGRCYAKECYKRVKACVEALEVDREVQTTESRSTKGQRCGRAAGSGQAEGPERRKQKECEGKRMLGSANEDTDPKASEVEGVKSGVQLALRRLL